MIQLIVSIAAILAFSPLEATISAENADIEGPQAASRQWPSRFQVDFEALQAELQRHRELAVAGGWKVLDRGPTIRPGDGGPRIAALADRLAASGDLEGSETPASYYDETLQTAVRDFQLRHGLEPDALVGRATLRELNVPVEQRVDQIRVNLERIRPYLDIDVEHYVLVNIAAFEATLVRGGQAAWTTKVIIGEEEDQTPEFRSELKSVVFNPTWSVPYSIASEEMLPRIVDDPGYFANNGYDVFDSDGKPVDPASVHWSNFSERNFPFRLVQRPGPKNQLGQIKFMMPNPYSICMHDTPARSLFANVNRALSHGCVRIDDPLKFAELVLESNGMTREDIEMQLQSGETRTLALAEPLPVYIVYWTAEAGDRGVVQFYQDIYKQDAGAIDALQESAPLGR
jgi:murein L,D-transpeptidase YcbB/YkuD